MERNPLLKGLDDWAVVRQFLPLGWEEAARRLGALRRARGIGDADVLLRLLMVHLVDGCSLKETALRARQAGWCSISPVSIVQTAKGCGAMAPLAREAILATTIGSDHKHGLPRPGRRRHNRAGTRSDGHRFAVHFVINLRDLQCDHFELTDVKGGETFRRIPIEQGDLLLGDEPPERRRHQSRCTSRRRILVGVNHKSLPLYNADDKIALATCRRLSKSVTWASCPHGPCR